jgi:hypothetical protein
MRDAGYWQMGRMGKMGRMDGYGRLLVKNPWKVERIREKPNVGLAKPNPA